MDKGTKEVIKRIADIQVSAIESIINDDYRVNHRLLCRYLQITPTEVKSATNQLLTMYQNISSNPLSFVFLPEYQVGVCAHILFEMEDVWAPTLGSDAIHGAWRVIGRLNKEYHPEYSLVDINKYK